MGRGEFRQKRNPTGVGFGDGGSSSGFGGGVNGNDDRDRDEGEMGWGRSCTEQKGRKRGNQQEEDGKMARVAGGASGGLPGNGKMAGMWRGMLAEGGAGGGAGGEDGGTAVRRQRRRRRQLEDGGVAMTLEKNYGRGKEWRQLSQRRRRRRRQLDSFPAFLEQPLEREITPFFLQMTARVCGGGGGSLPLL